MAAAASRNEVLPHSSPPRWCSTPGGWSPCVGALYRSPWPQIRQPDREVSLPAFCLVGRVAARGLVQAWRVERTRSSRGGFGHRRRVWLQGRGGLGRVPDRWIFGVVLISSTASVCCSSSQSQAAMELLSTWGWWIWRREAAGGGGCRLLPVPAYGGPRDSFVISLFVRVLCASLVVRLSSVSYVTVSVFVRFFVLYP